ncbi:MAG: hypothetical protein ABIH42_04690, partial [Planctomycetota bacterium]
MLKRRSEEEKRKRDELLTIRNSLINKLNTVKEHLDKESIESALRKDGDFLAKLEKILCKVSPEIGELISEAKKKVGEKGDNLRVIGKFYSGLADKCIENVERIAIFQYELRHK